MSSHDLQQDSAIAEALSGEQTKSREFQTLCFAVHPLRYLDPRGHPARLSRARKRIAGRDRGSGCARSFFACTERQRERGKKERSGEERQASERACSRYRVTPKSFSSRYDSLLYALDGPPSVSCSEMLVEESEIDTTRCAHALLPSRALMHCQGRIDPLCPTADIFRHPPSFPDI